MHTYVATALALAVSGASALVTSPEHSSAGQPVIKSRQIKDKINDAYDFIVVGGGLAGLVVGARLSADPSNSVLVIEAGGDGSSENDQFQINVPSNAYWGDLWDSPLNWKFTTTPQPELNGMEMNWPRGKVLGGSSAINGLYLTRPGELEINTWHDMLDGVDGADNWTWESLLGAMKKSETFHPPSAEVAKTAGIVFDASSRGTDGPLQVTYPGWQDAINGAWVPSNKAIGNTGPDPYGGDNWGAWICTSTINPSNWTRSYSKSAYLDALPWRNNYDILTDALVTKIEFDTSKTPLLANAVQYTPDNGTTFKSIKINKEVILSGGSIGSPTVLQYSGIGDKDVLTKAGVKVISDLPGVGAHLQDHPSSQIVLKSNQLTAGDQIPDNPDPLFFSFVNDAVAYPGSSILFGGGSAAQKSSIEKNLGKYAPTGDATVKAGYDAITKATMSLWDSKVGQVELLMGLAYTNESVNLQVTLQHQLSHGSIYINSNDPTRYPTIDPNYLANPADIDIMVAGLKKVRELSQSGPLAGILTEVSPGDKVQSDADWEDFLRKTLYTEFHPACTCSMLPKEQGGVVDGNLLVYDTANVRVADASIPPIEFSSHLMGSTYGIGEKAAEIILDHWKSPSAEDFKGDPSQKGRLGTSGASANASSNGGSTLAAALIPIVSASFAVAACIVFG